MSETLQQKMDRIYDNWYADELNEAIPIIEKALQEFREQIETLGTKCDCPLCNERTRTIKNVLALIGEKNEL